MTKEGESQGLTDPEELLTIDKTINPEGVERDTADLLNGLSELDVHLIGSAEIRIVNIPPIEIKQKANYARWRMREQTSTTDIPSPVEGLSREELIRDTTEEYLLRSTYFIRANMLFTDQPFQLFLLTIPETDDYSYSLVMPTVLRSNKEMLLGSLPPTFTSVGFAYDLSRNPQLKRRLSELTQRRVPAEIIDKDPLHKSSADGKDTPDGINTIVNLYLQDPNPQSFLECYETERFPEGNSRKDDTPKYVKEFIPEANWQESENHNCLIPRKSDNTYPLIPSTNLDKISKLIMIISCRRGTPQVMFDLFGDLPLSIDWTNQWYASESNNSKNGYMQLLFKPEWGDNNAALVYHKSSKERILPEDIHSALIKMESLQSHLRSGVS